VDKHREMLEEHKDSTHELFKLSNILSVSLDEPAGGRRKDVIFSVVTFVEIPEESINFIAAYCSNGNLILRQACQNRYIHSKASYWKLSIPFVKIIRWFDHPLKQICAMSFSPDGTNLFCLTNDATGYLLPVSYIMNSSSNIDLQLSKSKKKTPNTLAQLATNSLNQNTNIISGAANIAAMVMNEDVEGNSDFFTSEGEGVIEELGKIKAYKTTSKPEETSITDCIWWRSFSGEDYAVMSTLSGRIIFVDLKQNKRCFCKLKKPISKIELIKRPEEKIHKLLIHVLEGGFYMLLLEQPGNVPNNFILFPKHHQSRKSQFIPVPITRFSQESKLSVHYLKHEAFIAVYSALDKKLEIYDSNLKGFPLYVYFITPARSFHLTKRFTFAIGADDKGLCLDVVSNILASSSTESNSLNSAVLQKIMLPANSPILGIQRFPMINDDIELSPSIHLWTSAAIYELKSTNLASKTLNQLINGNDPTTTLDNIGKTLGLNMMALYEYAGDRAFENCDYQRALSFFKLSNARMSKLITKFLQCGELGIDISIDSLKNALSTIAECSSNISNKKLGFFFKSMTKILGKCFAEKILSSKEKNYDEIFEYIGSNSSKFDLCAMVDQIICMQEFELLNAFQHDKTRMFAIFDHIWNGSKNKQAILQILLAIPELLLSHLHRKDAFAMLSNDEKLNFLHFGRAKLSINDYLKLFVLYHDQLLEIIPELSANQIKLLIELTGPENMNLNQISDAQWDIFLHAYVKYLKADFEFDEDNLEKLVIDYLSAYNSKMLVSLCCEALLWNAAAFITEKLAEKSGEIEKWVEAGLYRINSKNLLNMERVLSVHVRKLGSEEHENERSLLVSSILNNYPGPVSSLESKLMDILDIVIVPLRNYIFPFSESLDSASRSYPVSKIKFSIEFIHLITKKYLEYTSRKDHL
jgi:hypothetical protein